MPIDMYEGPRSDEWETPPGVIDAVTKDWSPQFDMAASDKNHKFPIYRTKHNSALTEPWPRIEQGVCWLNPPFTLAREFYECVLNNVAWRSSSVVSIYKCSNTETALWQDLIFPTASWVLFLRGRVNYIAPDNKNTAPFPSALIGWNCALPKTLDGYIVANK